MSVYEWFIMAAVALAVAMVIGLFALVIICCIGQAWRDKK